MKKTVFYVLLVQLLAFGFIGCDNGNGTVNNDPKTVTYTGFSGDVEYSLKITENINRSIYEPKNGDSYKFVSSGKISSGSVSSISGTTFTLIPSNSLEIFTATVSGNNLTAMSGTITWNDLTTMTAPSSLTSGVNGDNIFIVTFDLDGGNISGNTASVEIVVKPDETISNLPFPQKSSYIFGGWFSHKNGAGDQYTTLTKVNLNITVYAKWLDMGNPFIGETMTFTGQVMTNEPNYTTFNGNLNVISSDRNDINCTGTITSGQLILNVGTPIPNKPLTDFFESTITNWWENYYYSNDAKCAAWESGEVSESDYSWLERRRQFTDVWSHEEVRYLYVDKDITVTAKGKNQVDSYNDDGVTYIYTTSSFDITLNLKKGWNAVYFKLEDTSSTTSAVTLLLANPDHLYWVIY